MKTYLPILLCFVSVHFSMAQSLVKQPTFASPNAAALGKYADIPVSYHTGVPNISIPIYTIEEGPLSLPVTLSYHSSGIRVDELASWVGLGWSLNAGGMISRTVQGGPDEGVVGSLSGGQSPYVGSGWYKDMGIPQAIWDCSARPLSTEGPESGTYPLYGGCASIYRDASEGLIDCEPDLFTFNFGEYSGKFFFDANRNIRMIPESDLHIVPVNSPSYFYSWKIIAPDGTKYFFGELDATEISYSDPAELSGDKRVSASTTWYVYRIESANGENWISFDYEDDSYSFGNRGGHTITFRESDTDTNGQTLGSAGSAGDIVGSGLWGSGINVNVSDRIINTTIVDAKRLKQITTSSGYVTVDFIPSTTAREDLTYYDKSIPAFSTETPNTISKRLQHIKITSSAFCKNFELSHDYYNATQCSGCSGATWDGSTFDKKRLRLNWVQESVCNGELLPKYEFFYNTQALPRRYSLARDMWGYYNGIESNTGLLETFTNPVLSGVSYTTSNYRTVSESAGQAGILTKIKYPTGGFAEFLYEGHREIPGADLIGGLRIKELKTTDGFGPVVVKQFQYPFGKLYLNPVNYKYQYPNNNDQYTYAFLGMFDFGISHSSNPLPPMWSSQGYHIGYTKVKVIEPGNGYSIYTYLNSSPLLTMPFHFPYQPSVAGIGTSDLTQQSSHVNGNTDDNVFISLNTMTRSNTGTTTTTSPRTVQRVSCLNCPSGSDTQYGIYMDYHITTHRFNLTEKVEKFDAVTTTTTLTYGTTHNNPKSQEITDSNGIVRRTEWLYPGETGATAPLIMYDKNNADFKNMIASVVEEKRFVNGVLRSRVNNAFTQSGIKIFLNSEKTYPSGTSDFFENQYEYDGNSNIINIKRSNGENTSYFWGYNKAYPIAEIKNGELGAMTVSYTPAPHYAGANITSTDTNVPLTTPFEIYSNQTVNPSMTVSAFGPTGGLCGEGCRPPSPFLVVRLKKDGIVQYTFNCTWDTNNIGQLSLTPGIYQWFYDADVTAGSGFNGYDLDITTPYVSQRTGYKSFHTSFEEDGVADSDARTGSKVWSGIYELVLPGDNGNYKLTYWQKSASNAWALIEQSITITAGTVQTMNIGSSGSLIDEVRLMPIGAVMTTYTYDPIKGITSSTDANQISAHYKYDDFGRLKFVLDDEKNVIKANKYHYKGQ